MPIYAQSSTLRDLIIPLVDIDYTSLQQDDVLQFNATTGKFENTSLTTGSNSVITDGLNVGGGEEVFKSKNSDKLEFRTLTASTGISVSTVGDSVVIAADGASATGVNIGTGVGIFDSKVGDDLQFRSLSTGATSKHLFISTNVTNDTIEFTSDAEKNTMSNLGAGFGLFAQKVVEDLQVKSLVSGDNISFSDNGQEITINAYNEPNTAQTYSFDLTFDGSGNVNSILNVPSGWTITRVGNRVTITHTTNRMVKTVSYMGRDAVNGWQMRFPTAGFQATVPFGVETTTIVIDINASVAGADASSTARVNVIF